MIIPRLMSLLKHVQPHPMTYMASCMDEILQGPPLGILFVLTYGCFPLSSAMHFVGLYCHRAFSLHTHVNVGEDSRHSSTI